MATINTPSYDLKQFANVYEPGEDTFLLLDALESDIDTLTELRASFIAEIGCGSGVVITALASFLQKSAICIATDINREACLATSATASINNVSVECCLMNLLCGFRRGTFDLLVFNPPYVVTEPSEIQGTGLARAWAGGRDGREIIDKFLLQLPSLLSGKGICYLLVIKENKPEEIRTVLESLGLKAVVLKERKILGEYLFVLKICKERKH